ncbi:hypothetical protein A2419_00210 [Candidatus Adlerbacteria bacterium RIFOXYC1_FULL_48_26]|uniref:Uncharacterized protein n=1 Tax=Candidatus Adlerbacteria bacterium RIFOXYC1_FULL_48_26 TaxID=1797247 RepID=A0A1F4Y240_9BACT|nr:MAG: hypothetical protein A2419_00210 [Candidatus Adlerbacteria bacterium RIFOXYC1_FULL_48_26]OGC94433.1 MAG: hypothetical protein A2389_02515 [Candidatus Adlerbacteria bacterium RIFOXYB1_FULL_48_10]
MSYESRADLGLMGARTNRRVKVKVDKDAEAAEKIASFFSKMPGLDVRQGSCTYVHPSKINVKIADGVLTVDHRNKRTTVVGPHLDVVEAAFREWCAEEMCHAKVFPRKCSKQNH